MDRIKVLGFLIIIFLLNSCSEKEYEMTSVNLTKSQIEICFNQDMTDLNLKMEFELVDGTKITANDNLFFCSMRFDESTNCIKRDKTLWNDKYLKLEKKKYWEELKTADIKSIKWEIEEFAYKPISNGIFYNK